MVLFAGGQTLWRAVACLPFLATMTITSKYPHQPLTKYPDQATFHHYAQTHYR